MPPCPDDQRHGELCRDSNTRARIAPSLGWATSFALVLLTATAGAPASAWRSHAHSLFKQGAHVAGPASDIRRDAVPVPRAGAPRRADQALNGTPKNRHVAVDTAAGLFTAARNARPGDAIILLPGTYRITRDVPITRPGTRARPIVVRARKLGEAKIEFDTLQGFHVRAPFWIFENLHIKGACKRHHDCEHAFHLVGEASGTIIRNNRVHDFNAIIKSNKQWVNGAGIAPKDVLIERNHFYNTSVRDTGHPVTLIDVVGGTNWVVRENLIADFAKGRGNKISYGGFLKGGSHHGLFERNLIICEWKLKHDGGIRIGLSFGGGGSGPRVCGGRPCSPEHTGGIMRNNVIMHCPTDVGIYLNKARHTRIIHNTLYNTRGIDVRFPESTAEIRNNVLGGRIRNRNGGTSTRTANLVGVSLPSFRSWYAQPDQADFSVTQGSPLIDGGTPVPGLNQDFCSSIRSDGKADLGAVEYSPGSRCNPGKHWELYSSRAMERRP